MLPLRVMRNCFSDGRYGFRLVGSPISLIIHMKTAYLRSQLHTSRIAADKNITSHKVRHQNTRRRTPIWTMPCLRTEVYDEFWKLRMPQFNMQRSLRNSQKIPQVRKPKKAHANSAEMKELPAVLIHSLGTLDKKLDNFRVQLHSTIAMGIWEDKLKDYQDQVGHFETRLSPAWTNSSGVSTPFSLKADTVRGLVILSIAPLNASWRRCVKAIFHFQLDSLLGYSILYVSNPSTTLVYKLYKGRFRHFFQLGDLHWRITKT